MKKIFQNNMFHYTLVLLAGILVGWILFHDSDKITKPADTVSYANHEETWTCAMHSQIRLGKPGKCPICGMDLIPLGQNVNSIDPDAIHLSPEAAQLANVTTWIVGWQKSVKEIRLYGKVAADERSVQSQVSHLSGRIEKLYVNFTGEKVIK